MARLSYDSPYVSVVFYIDESGTRNSGETYNDVTRCTNCPLYIEQTFINCCNLNWRRGLNFVDKEKYTAEDLLKITNYKLTFNEDLTEATLRTDGLQFADYDQKTFFPKVTSMLAISQAASTLAHYKELDSTGKTFRDFKKLTEGKAPFLLSSRIQFYPPFYDMGIPKSPMVVKVRGGPIGTSTIGYIATKYAETGEVLCKNDTMIMVMDRHTYRPVAHPEWWTSIHKKQGGDTTDNKSQHVKILSPPDDALRYQIRVTGGDIDLNQHTSWLNYVRFAQDAIYHFAKRNDFQEDANAVINSNKVKKIELLYAGETFEGDILDVLVWISVNEKADVYTHIIKDTTVVFQGRFQYSEQIDGVAPDNNLKFHTKL